MKFLRRILGVTNPANLLVLAVLLGVLGCELGATGPTYIDPLANSTYIQTEDAHDGVARGDTCWWGFYAHDTANPYRGLAVCAYKQKIRNPMVGGPKFLPVEHSRAKYYIEDNIFTMYLYPLVRLGGTRICFEEKCYDVWSGDIYDYECTYCNPTILEFDITYWDKDSMYLTARTGTWGGDFGGGKWAGLPLTSKNHSAYNEDTSEDDYLLSNEHVHTWILIYEQKDGIGTISTYRCSTCGLIRTE